MKPISRSAGRPRRLNCSPVWALLLLAAALSSHGVAALTVDLYKYFGTVSMSVGTEVPIKCIASDVNQVGRFEWYLGDERLPQHDQAGGVGVNSQTDEHTYETSLVYHPDVAHHGKELVCRYVVYDQQGRIMDQQSSDSITLFIRMLRWTPNPVLVKHFQLSAPLTINVTLDMFPPPEPSQVKWVLHKAGSERPPVELHPQDRDADNRVLAGALQPQAPSAVNQYSTWLLFRALEPSDVAGQTYLLINQGDDRESRIDVRFSAEPEGLPGGEDDPQRPPSPSSEVSSMNVGIIVIIVIVVVIILICLAYCVYKQCSRRPQPEPRDAKSRGRYSAPPE